VGQPDKPEKCPQCPKAFAKAYILNRHIREVHNNPNRKTIKHIRENGKVLCPICRKDFTHTASLKKHIITNHDADEVEEKGINPEHVVGQPLKKIKDYNSKTTLEDMVDQNALTSQTKLDQDTFDIVYKVSAHCPKLLLLALYGAKQILWEERLYKAITTKVCRDAVMRFWRFDDFALDYQLGQQFNYEWQILCTAFEKNMQHIAMMKEYGFTSYCFMMVITRYEMDLRTYLRKHRDYRKLNDILL
jgi:hypothetical protein